MEKVLLKVARIKSRELSITAAVKQERVTLPTEKISKGGTLGEKNTKNIKKTLTPKAPSVKSVPYGSGLFLS